VNSSEDISGTGTAAALAPVAVAVRVLSSELRAPFLGALCKKKKME
jgi:hypothetical protein